MNFFAIQPQLFFSKNDPEDPRLGDYFKSVTLNPTLFKRDDLVVLGYPDDEGIAMNGGRPGACEAPQTIRQFLYKMTWPYATAYTTAKSPSEKWMDLGDLHPTTGTLEERHSKALETMTALHGLQVRTVSFGGGHDYGYADAAGFVKNHLKGGKRPLVINFDAHLDVRPTTRGPNSGTSFYRLLSEFGEQIDFMEIGLQPQCNSVFHRNWALTQKAFLYDLKDTCGEKLMQLFEKPPLKHLTSETPVFVSFDIDALSSSEAGGCSQAWVTGLQTQPCLNFLTELDRRSNCRGLGIYEVSPRLDFDFRTSKTAALLAYHFIFRL